MTDLQSTLDQLDLEYPDRGFVATSAADRWEDGMIVGNGSQGALCFGRPHNEEIVLSHESLFLPIYPAGKFIHLAPHWSHIQDLVLKNRGGEAMALTMDLARESGYPERTLTDPFIGACSLKIAMSESECAAYARSVDFETGDSVTAWKDGSGVFHRRVFASRAAGVVAVRIASPHGTHFNASLELARIERDLDPEFYDTAVVETTRTTSEGLLVFRVRLTEFSPDQALHGYSVAMRVVPEGGRPRVDGDVLNVADARGILLLIAVEPELACQPVTSDDMRLRLDGIEPDYERLLADHARIHSEIFGRASFTLCDRELEKRETGELRQSSSVGDTTPALVQKAFDAGRYGTISSTGSLPPALQGIWTGTWRPRWSGDFTLNGNLQSAVAASLPGNHYEALRATLDYLSGLMDDFRSSARELFGFRGIWVPWRSSTHGQCHYAGYKKGPDSFPGTYWFAGTAWWAWFYYDYWLHTGDEEFFRNQLKPYFLGSADFYENYLSVERDGRFALVPSYSPENEPPGAHGLQPNATMTIAAIRQLLRCLLSIADRLGVDAARQERWRSTLTKMPNYRIDPSGALAEWAWPAVTNNEDHRHASHLYPVYDGVAPEIEESPELREACRVAIEKRLEYRRSRNGAEMAFGLTQLGMSASYLRDTRLAYECVEWLVNSYWSPAMVSQHDPGDILNLDISGGLPAVIITMLVQSFEPKAAGTPWRIAVLPCRPDEWPEGSIEGVRCRGGFEVSIRWSAGSLKRMEIVSLRGERCEVEYDARVEEVRFDDGRWVYALTET